MATMATVQQMRAIYGLGRALSLSTGNRDDLLHQFVESRTGRESIKELTKTQAEEIIRALKDQMRGCSTPPNRVDGMSAAQIRKVWQLMYKLRDLDEKPMSGGVGVRLCGIIQKELGISAIPKAPFQWLDYRQGNKLIERIKFYIKTIERRKLRGENNG